MIINRRAATLAILSGGGKVLLPSSITNSNKPTLVDTEFSGTILPLFLAAPGIKLDAPTKIQKALQNPDTTIVDARTLDEILKSGYFAPRNKHQHWLSASCTVEGGCPLLDMNDKANNGLILPDKKAPVVVYCGTGKRAAMAQAILKEQGYTQVYNMGAYPADTKEYN